VLGVQRRALGEEHPAMLTTASNFTKSLSAHGKHSVAEQILREVLDVMRRVIGEEHPATLTTASNLALSLIDQRRHAEAERIQRDVLGAQRRTLGEEHPDALMTANTMAVSLSYPSVEKCAEAAQILQAVLAARRRVLRTVPSTPIRSIPWRV